MIPYIQDCRRVVEDDNGSQIRKYKSISYLLSL